MLKKVAGGLLLFGILSYVVGVVTKNAFVYILCFAMLVAAILFGLLVLAMDLVWKLLPTNLRKTYKGKRGRFNAIIFFSVALFWITREILDQVWLCNAPGFIGLLGNTITFVFAVFLGWSLIRRSTVKTIIMGGVVFILIIVPVLFFNSITFKSGKIDTTSNIEKLSSLGYLEWVPAGKDIEKRGVVQYNAELAFDGINIYSSISLPEAYLVDMQGNVVHKWTKNIKGGNNWHDVQLCQNGDLLVVAADQMLIRLDWDSNVKWKKKMLVHHDVSVDENEQLYTVMKESALLFWHGIPFPILSDSITVLSAEGEIKNKLCIYDLVKEQIPLRSIIYRTYRWLRRFVMAGNLRNFIMGRVNVLTLGADLLHTNSIEIMDRDIEGFCRKGDWLISIRHLDLIGVLDPKKEELVWAWGPGEMSMQHHATLLKNGNVLVFDNGYGKGFSRAIELNPLTKKVVWEYKSDPPEKFFSPRQSSCQRLPNDNTLVTEGDSGYVFEITKEGRIVWEFYNPATRLDDQKRRTIYRMLRIIDPKIEKLIKNRI